MDDTLCFGDVGMIETAIEQAFLDSLIFSEGLSYGNSEFNALTENSFKVEDNPTARINYPWTPTTPEAEAFFTNSHLPSIFDGWQEQEISLRAAAFLGSVDRVWSVTNLQTTLVERFAARIPQTWLAAIAQRAQKIAGEVQQTVSDTSTILADQLVQCVREIAPSLAEEDFYVLARPLVPQMRTVRSGKLVDSVIEQVPQVDWDQLSDVQRARLGLAIARYAIDELQTVQDD